jgi:alkaline phosphatase
MICVTNHRSDKQPLDLIETMTSMEGARKFTYAKDSTDLAKLTTTPALGLFASNSMAYEIDREAAEGDQPALSAMTTKALELMDIAMAKRGNKGMFMLVEASQIDVCSHKNDAACMMQEILEWDKTMAGR